MRRIAIDTSSILFSIGRNADIFEVVKEQFPEYKAIISKGVMRELKRAAKKRGRIAMHARVALELIKKHGVEVAENREYVDKWIAKEAGKGNLVCTNDAELRHAIKKSGASAYTFSTSRKLR